VNDHGLENTAVRTLLRLKQQSEIGRLRGKLDWKSIPVCGRSFKGVVTPQAEKLDVLRRPEFLAIGDLVLTEVVRGIRHRSEISMILVE
jgi:hypothetical protein